ncbi:MAG: phosphohydrolase [Candidatus Binatia bacterium]|nr:MAG: phosphohydrolase [Candidatus Binatia bacterium]
MVVRDPVHGDVEVSEPERRILDTPEVQRLRGIKQLGTAYLVYPGCTHTRFEHSLGTCHLAHRIVTELRRKGARISAELETALGIAALLHDVTHVPFGHTLEDERRLFPRHDRGTRLGQVLSGGVGEELRRSGFEEPVASILGVGDGEVPAWLRDVVSSTVDADLLDYLRRDAYFSGLAQSYDDRVFRYFCLERGRLALDMSKHGMERPDARSECIQLLRTRYFLSERVYYHHTKVAAGAMVSKAVEIAQGYGRLDERELLGATDASLLSALAEIPDPRRPDPDLRRLSRALLERRLYKRAYVLSGANVPPEAREELVRRFHEDRAERQRTEKELAREVGCREAEVIVYCPARTVMKEAAALVRTPSGVFPLNERKRGLEEIRALEARYEELWRFYVFVPEEHVDRASSVAQEHFGFPNEFSRSGR